MTPKVPDPHAPLRDKLLRTVLDGPRDTEPASRYAAAEEVRLADALTVLGWKIHRHAYRVKDDKIAALQAEYADDRLFENIVSAAVGASRRRLTAGIRAMEEA